MKALVVDDSRAIRAMLKKILSGIGYEVIEAEHGKHGLTQLESSPNVDIALVDWNMPEMNGIEFVQAVRANPAYQELALMMVTTEDDMERVVQALEAGANEYIMKPFTEEGIREKLELLGLQTG